MNSFLATVWIILAAIVGFIIGMYIHPIKKAVGSFQKEMQSLQQKPKPVSQSPSPVSQTPQPQNQGIELFGNNKKEGDAWTV